MGRGLAALAVVLFHADGSIFPAQKYWGEQVFGGIFGWGEAGIFYFFVLSGFIIAHVHAADAGHPERLRRYLMRRFVRIYPVYWVVLAGIALLGAVGVGGALTSQNALSSVLLVGPDNRDTGLAVAWTLYHEIAFYAVFAAWIVNVRLGAAVTLAWLAAIGAAAVVGAGPLPAYLVASVNLLFGLGVAAWWASRHAVPGSFAVAGLIGFAALAVDKIGARLLTGVWQELAFGVASALIIAGLAAHERQRPVAVPRLLVALGAASYSIYLTHFPLLSLFAKLAVAGGIVGRVPVEVGFAATIALTLACGWGFHRMVERPLLARLGR